MELSCGRDRALRCWHNWLTAGHSWGQLEQAWAWENTLPGATAGRGPPPKMGPQCHTACKGRGRALEPASPATSRGAGPAHRMADVPRDYPVGALRSCSGPAHAECGLYLVEFVKVKEETSVHLHQDAFLERSGCAGSRGRCAGGRVICVRWRHFWKAQGLL